MADDQINGRIPLWQTIASTKKQQRDDAVHAWGVVIPDEMLTQWKQLTNVKFVPQNCGLLSTRQLEITETAPSLLLQMLASGTYSAEETLRAFLMRTVIAHDLTNPLSEIFFQKGLARARELDEILQRTGYPVGPLHGLPVSIKDPTDVKGEDTTMGIVAFVGHPKEQSDRLYDQLYAAGAVMYCKTNMPQTGASGECVNYIFGRTSTPWNITLSAGGSSGGEGSLISLGGGAIGIGSDIAGSIRTPANFCGIYGLCPTTGRFPGHDVKRSRGMTPIKSVLGPLTRSVDGLETYTRTILQLQPWKWDSECLRIPWRQDEYEEGLGEKRKLRIGLIQHDNYVIPHPPIRRGMREIQAKLESAGHEIIHMDPFEGKEIDDLCFRNFHASGDQELRDVLAILNEPLIAEAVIGDDSEILSVAEYKQCAAEIFKIRQRYLDIWEGTAAHTKSGEPIDAIIFPSGGHVAPPHGTMEYFTYELISNVLDWTCATYPVGFVDPSKDPSVDDLDIDVLSDFDRRNRERWNLENYKDGPVCLQVLGQRHTEEKIIGVLRAIDKAYGRGPYYQA